MKILVTGAAGFIGSHTIFELLTNNYEVIAVDNCINSYIDEDADSDMVVPESLRRVQLLAGRKLTAFLKVDLQNELEVQKIFERFEVDAVIHFAALKAVGESCQMPLAYYRNNINGTINVLEAMKNTNVRKFIFSSSATVYGNPEYLPIDEKHPTGRDLTNPYGKSKFFCEEILQDACRSTPGLCTVSLRYFNPVGAHPSGEIGEDPRGVPNNLMPYLSQVAVGRRPYLSVFGNDFDTCDGTGVRDYIHIMDLAAGHVAALDKMIQEEWSGWRVFNLGSGRGHSVLQVIGAWERATGVKIAHQICARRPGDIDSCYADCTKAKLELNWETKFSMADACCDAWRWQSKYPFGFNCINNNNNIVNGDVCKGQKESPATVPQSRSLKLN